MPVVINEFEAVPTPPQPRVEPAASPPPGIEPRDLHEQLRLLAERELRVSAD